MAQKLKQDMSIGQNIRALRLAAGLTQEQVVAKMQLKQSVISRSIYAQIESGSYNIRISELAALRQIFKCSYNDFFAGLED